MSTPDNNPMDEMLNAEAADWLIEQDEGFSPDRARAFAEWLAQDPRHAEAVCRTSETLLLFNELPKVRDAYDSRYARPLEPTANASPKGRSAWSHALPWAAGIAAVLALGAMIDRFGSSRPAVVEEVVYATEMPEPRRVALPDGSVVDLNENSQVRVRFSATERQVILVSGEAHFQVAHDPAKPFVVNAQGVSLRAVGTAFNVRLAGESVDLLVTEGKVELGSAASRIAAVVAPLLVAGERTLISGNAVDTPQIEKVAASSIRDLLAWQDRMTNFVDVPLRELVARMNRCNSTQLVLADADLGDRKVGGVIFLNRVDRFIQVLEREGDVVAEHRGSDIILRRAP